MGVMGNLTNNQQPTTNNRRGKRRYGPFGGGSRNDLSSRVKVMNL